MVIRSNSSFYGLPLGMFVAGIVVGTAVSIWRADFLYRQIICYLPAVHLQIQQTGFPSGFLLFVCRLRLPVFLLMAISIFSGFSLLVFSGTAFISGASAAVVITSATMLTGMVGILQALALFGVHSLFYLFGYWALYELAGKRRGFTFGEQIGILIRIVGVWAAGMGAEALLSPLVVTRVLRL